MLAKLQFGRGTFLFNRSVLSQHEALALQETVRKARTEGCDACVTVQTHQQDHFEMTSIGIHERECHPAVSPKWSDQLRQVGHHVSQRLRGYIPPKYLLNPTQPQYYPMDRLLASRDHHGHVVKPVHVTPGVFVEDEYPEAQKSPSRLFRHLIALMDTTASEMTLYTNVIRDEATPLKSS